MSGLMPFVVMKVGLVALTLGFAVRELWLLRHSKDDPELTQRMLRVLGGKRGRALNPPRPPAAAPELPTSVPEEEPEPLRRAA